MNRFGLNSSSHAVTVERLMPSEDLPDDASPERLGWPAAVIVIGALALVSWSLVGGLLSLLF
jgi:hypothetical protein